MFQYGQASLDSHLVLLLLLFLALILLINLSCPFQRLEGITAQSA